MTALHAGLLFIGLTDLSLRLITSLMDLCIYEQVCESAPLERTFYSSILRLNKKSSSQSIQAFLFSANNVNYFSIGGLKLGSAMKNAQKNFLKPSSDVLF